MTSKGMTDKERFEKRAKEMGATIIGDTEDNTLMVLSSNGELITKYTFTEDGKYLDSVSYLLEIGKR